MEQINSKKCPKCQGKIFKDADGPYCYCGWRPRKGIPEETPQWVEELKLAKDLGLRK